MDDKKIKIDEELIEDKIENMEKSNKESEKPNPFKWLDGVNKRNLIFGLVGLVLIILVI